MMRIRLMIVAVLVFTLVPIVLPALDIVKDGKPAATVVVPVFADTKEIRQTDKRWTEMAAGWLTNYVKKSTGADLKIVTEGAPVEGNIISIGHTKMAETAGIRIEEQKCSGSVCRLAVKGNTLYLIGRDEYGPTPEQTQRLTSQGWRVDYTCKGAKGTDKAVAIFLEDYVGCRWFIPTPQGEYVPARSNVSVPDNLDRTVTPVFPYITGGPYSVACSGEIWHPYSPALIANNFWQGIRIRSYGGHSWNSWVPINKYGKDHPEYFAVINGKRQVPGQFGPTNTNVEVNSYLCTSNPEVRDLLLKEIRRDFDEGWDWVQSCQADGFHRCECPECEKLDNYRIAGVDDPNNPCERIFLLHKYIIDECKKSHPDKKVHLMIYGPTGTPSKKIENFGENVTGEFCSDIKYLSLWKSKVTVLTVYNNGWWGTFKNIELGPKTSPRQLADDIRMFRDNKIVGIYQAGGTEDWGLEGPCYYTVGRLLGNPDLNPDDCVREYCQFVYGKAGNTMVQFFNTLYERVEFVRGINGRAERELVYPALFLPTVVQRLDGLLQKADKQADTERAKGWLKLTHDTFDFMRLTSEMFSLYHAYQIQKNLPALNALKDSVLKWKAFRIKLLEYGMSKNYYDLDVKDRAYIDNWYPGWEVVYRYFTNPENEGCKIQIHEPVTLDFDALARNLKNLTTKAAGPAKIVVPRAKTSITPDNLMSADIWKETPDYPLAGLSGNPITANTKVRLLFDNKNLYVAFECEEPEVDNMKLKEGKHDGDIWSDDCVEILLDPGATRSKYLHLMAVPKEGCYYDAQFGFITDPLHPTFGKEDTGWNPDWKYAFKVDKEGKKWMLVASIPFTSLGVEAPKAGALWTANFCRERHAGKNEELSLWSPNEYSNGFCEPMDFGEIYFEREETKTP